MAVPQSGVTEHVEPSKPCRTMFAAKPAADRRFSRVNCWGKLETRVSAVLVARALRPPLCPRSVSWGGPSAVAEVAELWFSNHDSATVTVNGALLRQLERCPDRYRRPAAPKAAGRQPRGIYETMRLGWLVRAAFVLRRLTSCSPFVLL
jgi:hypothetical protein